MHLLKNALLEPDHHIGCRAVSTCWSKKALFYGLVSDEACEW